MQRKNYKHLPYEMEQKIYSRLNNYKKEIELRGYEVIYIGLVGSHNYNLHDDDSDIDATAIVIPTLDQLLYKDKISWMLETKYGEVDVKDAMLFAKTVMKGNFKFIEAVETCYFLGDPKIKEIFSKATVNNMSIYGAILNKVKDIIKEGDKDNPDFLKSCKNLHHCLRLHTLLKDDDKFSRSFKTYTNEEQRKFLVKIKRYSLFPHTYDFIKRFARTIEEETKKLSLHKPNAQVDVVSEALPYIKKLIQKNIVRSTGVSFARHQRCPHGMIPGSDLKKFPKLKEYMDNKKDISYIVYEDLEIL